MINDTHRQQSLYNQRRLAEILANSIKAASLKPGEKDPTLWPDVHDLLLMSRGVDITPYPSIEGSIASRISAACGQLLPVEAEAFMSDIDCSFERTCDDLKRHTGTESPREFYQQIGITIQEPQKDLPGWYQCQLPDGWCAKQDTPTIGRDEQVVLYDAAGKIQFGVICSKFAKTRCCDLSLARSVNF